LIPPTQASQISPEFIARHPDYDPAQFNALKTWTEYVNRLLGAISGILLLATLLVSLKFWKRDHLTPLLLFGTMLLSAVVIWLGKL
jgi:cytochrome c oxidase assembly protein subunit 15